MDQQQPAGQTQPLPQPAAPPAPQGPGAQGAQPAEMPPRPQLSWPNVKWLLCVTMLTLVWTYFALEVLVGVALSDTRIGNWIASLVPSNTVWSIILFILFYVLVFVGYGTARFRLEGKTNPIGLLGDTKGLSLYYFAFGSVCLIVVYIAIELDALNAELAVLFLLAGLSLWLAAIPDSHSPALMWRWFIFYLFNFLRRLPLIGRYIPEGRRPEIDRIIDAGGVPVPEQSSPRIMGTDMNSSATNTVYNTPANASNGAGNAQPSQGGPGIADAGTLYGDPGDQDPGAAAPPGGSPDYSWASADWASADWASADWASAGGQDIAGGVPPDPNGPANDGSMPPPADEEGTPILRT